MRPFIRDVLLSREQSCSGVLYFLPKHDFIRLYILGELRFRVIKAVSFNRAAVNSKLFLSLMIKERPASLWGYGAISQSKR